MIRNITRRGFLKAAGLAGMGTLIGPLNQSGRTADALQQMPARAFGKTGVSVPILGFGSSLGTSLSPRLLRQAAKLGVTYWDTAHSYMGGNSEKSIGKYFAKYFSGHQIPCLGHCRVDPPAGYISATHANGLYRSVFYPRHSQYR
jgi:hypothetical protein